MYAIISTKLKVLIEEHIGIIKSGVEIKLHLIGCYHISTKISS